jgi:Spy/CpxP family protein refolding chaperone
MTNGYGRPSPLRLVLVVLAIFAAGAASGFALRSYLRPPFPMFVGGLPPWLRGLDLTDEQRRQADDIFARHRADVDVIMKDSFPKVRARNEQMEQELKAVLSAEQQKKLEDIRARRHAHGGDRNGPPGFGPPGAPGAMPPPDPGAPPPLP